MSHRFCYHYNSFLCLKPDVTRPSILLPFSFYLISRKPYRLKSGSCLQKAIQSTSSF